MIYKVRITRILCILAVLVSMAESQANPKCVHLVKKVFTDVQSDAIRSWSESDILKYRGSLLQFNEPHVAQLPQDVLTKEMLSVEDQAISGEILVASRGSLENAAAMKKEHALRITRLSGYKEGSAEFTQLYDHMLNAATDSSYLALTQYEFAVIEVVTKENRSFRSPVFTSNEVNHVGGLEFQKAFSKIAEEMGNATGKDGDHPTFMRIFHNHPHASPLSRGDETMLHQLHDAIKVDDGVKFETEIYVVNEQAGQPLLFRITSGN